MTLSYLPSVKAELCLSGGAFDFEASDTFAGDDSADTLRDADTGQQWIVTGGTAGISSNKAYVSAFDVNTSDTFTRADSTSTLGTADSGQSWSTLVGTGGTISNTAYFSAVTGSVGLAVIAGLADTDVQVTVSDFGSGQAGVVFRETDSTTYWRLRGSVAAGNYILVRRDAGADTAVGTYAGAPANGDVLRVHCEGDQISCYINDVLRIGPVTDSTYQTKTNVGLFTSNTSARFDNFTATSVRAAAFVRCLAGGDIQATVSTFGTAEGLVFRASAADTSNCWRFRGTGTDYKLILRQSGVDTVIDTYASAAVDGDILKVRCEGDTIKCYVNGTLRITATNTTFQNAPFAGLWSQSTSARFDDFSASFVWTDISAYLVEVSGVQRGRQHELDQMETGTADVVLDNRDRRFEPGYTAGAYYPYIVPLRRLRLTATWSAVEYPLFVGHIERWPLEYNEVATYGTTKVTAVDRSAVVGIGLWSDYPDTVLGLDPEAYWRMGAA